MLIDFHAHTSAISTCCKANRDQVIREAMRHGMHGMILTNHYKRSYVKDGDFDAFALRYTDEYYITQVAGSFVDFAVFFGAEVTMDFDPECHMLVLGVEPEFILKNPKIFEYSLKKLSNTVHEAGGVLVQAHPFRHNRFKLQDLDYLDGIEISCHPLYEGTHIKELAEIAYDAGIIITAGGDYHADTNRPKCGVHLDDNIRKSSEIADFIRNTDTVRLCIQEVDTYAYYEYIFKRKPKEKVLWKKK